MLEIKLPKIHISRPTEKPQRLAHTEMRTKGKVLRRFLRCVNKHNGTNTVLVKGPLGGSLPQCSSCHQLCWYSSDIRAICGRDVAPDTYLSALPEANTVSSIHPAQPCVTCLWWKFVFCSCQLKESSQHGCHCLSSSTSWHGWIRKKTCESLIVLAPSSKPK